MDHFTFYILNKNLIRIAFDERNHFFGIFRVFSTYNIGGI